LAVSSRSVFTDKVPADESIMEKARLVAQGFTQIDGVDCGKTFAPVAKFVSFGVMLATAALNGMEIHNMDVDSAFQGRGTCAFSRGIW
jgi:hypothetical protein